jgi:general secretion pathway protein G
VKELKNVREKEKTSEGFSFVETMAVMAIFAVLAMGTSVSGAKIIAKAKQISARNQIQQYYSALQSYFLDCGCYPTSQQGLQALWEEPVSFPVPENWNGPYLEHKPTPDPWGTDFEYISAESSTLPPEVPANLPFVLMSFGADKKEGGDGNAKDILSWQ